MEYITAFKRLKNCSSIICEYIADVLQKKYIDSDEIRKYINLCKIMAARNKKEYGEDIPIIPDDKFYEVIEFYTGISQDKLIKNNIKTIDSISYFSRFNYEELGRMIELCYHFVPENYVTEIVDACNYCRIILESYRLTDFIEPCFLDDGYLMEQIDIYIENNDTKKKLLNM